MSKKLAANVTVGRETYPAGSTPPKEIADQIDNPKAWGDEPDSDGASTTTAKKAPAKKSASRKSE